MKQEKKDLIIRVLAEYMEGANLETIKGMRTPTINYATHSLIYDHGRFDMDKKEVGKIFNEIVKTLEKMANDKGVSI